MMMYIAWPVSDDREFRKAYPGRVREPVSYSWINEERTYWMLRSTRATEADCIALLDKFPDLLYQRGRPPEGWVNLVAFPAGRLKEPRP